MKLGRIRLVAHGAGCTPLGYSGCCGATSFPCGMTSDESSCCLLARDVGSKLYTVCKLASLEASRSEDGACDTPFALSMDVTFLSASERSLDSSRERRPSRREAKLVLYLHRCAIGSSAPKFGNLVVVPGRNGRWRRSLPSPCRASDDWDGWWGKGCMHERGGGQLARLVTLSRRQIKEHNQALFRGTSHDLPQLLLPRA